MKIGIKKVARTIAFILALCAIGGAWAAAPVPVAEWSGDLADDSIKNKKYTMSMDSSDSSVVSFASGNAVLTSSRDVSSKGVQIAWPDPATDDASFTSRKMSVILQYSGLSILNGNTSLLSALWGDTATEYMVRTSSNNGTAGIATAVKSGATSAGTQYGPSSNFPAPKPQGKLLVCFSGDSSHRPGIDLYFSTYDSTTATYGDYQRVSYWSEQKVDNGTFYGLKIGGTIANTSKYYRPGMTVEAVQIYDTVVSASSATISADTSWSSLVWDHDVFDVVPASLYTYIINVSESATLDLSNATIPTAEKVLINVAADKTLTLTGTPTSSGAPIEIAGSGKVVLSSDPGCNIVVASGATLDISASTVSSAITNNGTVNANGCAFTGAVSNSGTLNTSGTVSFSSSVNNTFYYGSTLNVSSGTTTYNSSSDRQLKGNVTIQKYATLVNAKHDALNYDANSSTPVNVYIYGTLTMSDNWTIGKGYNTLHLYDGSLINGTVDNALHFNTGTAYIIAETGSSEITAPFVKGGGTISIETKAGATLKLPNHSSTAFAKCGAGTVMVRNARIPAITGSEGTVELYSDEAYNSTYHAHTITGVAFSGTVRVETSGSSYQVFLWSDAATAGMFANRPILDASGHIWLYNKIADYPVQVRNLTGNGLFRLNATRTEYRCVDTMQTADSTFSGSFITVAGHESGDVALTVRGAENAPAIYSLTLSGANTTTGPLAIENNAKVVFASTGSWAGGTVTVKNGGVLESQNSESIADRLVVQEGATLKFANGVPLAATEYDWSGVSNDQSVNVDLSGIAPSAMPVTLIASDVMIDAAKFKVSASQRTATLSVENGALKATFANFWTDGVWGAAPVANDSATLVLSQDSTLTVSEALTLGAVTVVKEGDGDVTLTVSGAGALTTGGWTIPAGVTVVTADGMEIAGDVTGGGIINVPENTTLTMDGVTTPGDTLADRVKVTVSGTLKTKGTTTLSAANTSAAGSLIEVVAGATTLSSAFKGLSGNITIDSGAELSWAESIGSNSNEQYYDHINPDGTTVLDIAGTLHQNYRMTEFGANNKVLLRAGALVDGSIGSTDVTSYYGYGHWTWLDSGLGLHAYGNAELAIYIRTPENVAPEFTVDENAVLTISQAFIPQTGRQNGAGSIVKAGAGTLRLKDTEWTKPISGSEGTVEVNTAGRTNDRVNHSVSGASFSGTLKVVTPSGKAAYFDSNPENQLTGHPELRLELGSAASQGSFYLGTYAINKYVKVRNLSGWGIVTPWLGQDGTCYYETVQEKDTAFSGTFINWSSTKLMGLTVKGGESVHSLTLGAASTTTGPLLIQDNGKVVFSGDGAWAGNVTVGANGYLESTNAAAVTQLTLQDGANIVFPASTSTLSSISALTFASGTTKIHFGSGVTPTAGTLINWSAANLEAAPAGEFAFADSTLAGEWILTKSADGLSIAAAGAQIVYSNGDVVPYTTMDYETLMAYTTAIGTDEGATLRILDKNTAIDADTIPYLAAQNLYYDNVTKTISKAVAKVVTTTYPSLSAAISDGAVVTLLRDSSEAITLNGESIVFSEGSSTFSGSFTGSGTLILGAPLAAADHARWAEGWTGIVELKDITTAITDFDFADYGNANSTVRANNVLVRMPETGGEYGNVGEINLVGEGLRFGGDPIAGQDFTFSAAISGTGKIRVGTRCETASSAHTRYIFKGDLSDFAGGVDYNDTGWYKATIVFQAGTDEIPAGNNGEWGQIILTENTTISLGGEMYGPAGIIVAGSINVLAGGSVRVDANSGQKIEGSGTITYATFPTSAPAFNNSWTGEVHLPGSASIAGTNFGNWGKSGSKIVLDGDVAGLIAQNTSVSAEMVLDGYNLTVNDFSQSSYSFSKISGSGNISFNHKENGDQPNSLTIGEIAPTYSGTVNNNTTTTLEINNLVLPNLPPCDAKVLAVGGTGEISLDVGNVKVGEASLPAKYKLERRHKGEEDDGFYVYYNGTIFSVY